MATRDPMFWKRFSTAVHFDEEHGHEMKKPDTWLGRQTAKKHKRTCVCWIFWSLFMAFVVGVVIAIAFCVNQGYFNKGIEGANPNHNTPVVN